MKVLLVGGGDIPIPPPRWGGVENLIWQQKAALERAGHEAHILNKKRKRVVNALRALPWRYDVVHLHMDRFAGSWVPLSRLFRFPLVVSTHFGYAAFPDRWTDSYRKTVKHMSGARHLLLLSEEMKRVFAAHGCQGTISALPNGINCCKVRFAPAAAKQAIVLARIEKRKRQARITQALDRHTVECDFAGPIDDAAGFAPNGRNTRYLGEWSREQVHRDLTEYACLVLLSDGEGHAAVVSEAMAAGLSLVLSPEASHNLDLSLPWIHVVDGDREALGDVMQRAVRDNHRYRREIRAYCEANFDWDVILPKYVRILEQVACPQRGKA